MLPVTIDLRRNALFIVCDIGCISGVGLERRKLLVSHPAPPMIDGGMSLHKEIFRSEFTELHPSHSHTDYQ